MAESFYLGAYWKARRRTLREYIAESKDFLAALQELHPAFRRLVSWGDTEESGVELLPDLSNLEDLIFRRGPSDDALFSPAGSGGAPTLDSYCSRGFITVYSNGSALAEEKVRITIIAGTDSPWLSNSVVINFPQAIQAFREYAFIRQLLEVVLDCWAPDMAIVSSSAFNEKLDGQGGRKAVGWMTWFADPAVQEALPEGVERQARGGGMLVVTAHEAVSPSVPGHAATARLIRESLRQHGYLK
jgi:hypothetical protein